MSTGELEGLASTTVVLLLTVFTIVNVAVLALRREGVEHEHFRAPSILPVLGALSAGGLVVYRLFSELRDVLRAAILVAVGIALYAVNRALSGRVDFDAEQLEM